jgi:hypothetical protein
MTADAILAYLERPDPLAQAACALAVALSPAAFVEPVLLRAVRLEALPHLSVEAEADLWFSPLVRDRTPDGISLEPSALSELRRRLVTWLDDAVLRERATRAADLILGRDATELRRVAEKVTWWSLSEGDAADARIARELAPVLDAVRSGRSGHARWAVRTLPGLPDAAHRSPVVWQLAAHASSATQRPVDLEPPTSALFETLRVEGLPYAELPVRRLRRSLEIGAFPADRALGIRVPDTRPWCVEVRSDSGTEVVTLLAGDARTVEVGDGDVRLRTISGDVFRLPPRRPLVFISDATDEESIAVADAISRTLEASELEPWIGRVRLQPGEPWADAVRDAQARADAGILVLTRGGFESEWVRSEADALARRHRSDPTFILLPLLVGVDPSALRDPGFASHGIDQLSAVQADDPKMAALTVIDRLAPLLGRSEARSPVDPLHAPRMRGTRVLLDRTGLREGLRRLQQQGGIMVVNGPPGSGKSYSLHFIVYVAEVTGDFHVASVDVGPMGAARYTSGMLADSLARQMGVTAPRPDRERESDARYNMALADWLFGKAVASARTWWWVLDGFGADVVAHATRDLIFQLAQRIARGSESPRLVLLDFPEPLPADVEPYVYRDEIAPIGPRELELFVETQDVAGSPEDRDAIVAAILDGLPDGPARLAELSRRVNAVVAAGQQARA